MAVIAGTTDSFLLHQVNPDDSSQGSRGIDRRENAASLNNYIMISLGVDGSGVIGSGHAQDYPVQIGLTGITTR